MSPPAAAGWIPFSQLRFSRGGANEAAMDLLASFASIEDAEEKVSAPRSSLFPVRSIVYSFETRRRGSQLKLNQIKESYFG